MDFIRSEKDYAIVMALKNRDIYQPDMFEGIDQIPTVYIAPFIPQKAVLNHTHAKMFFTHGGQGSMFEAIEARVPMLSYPMSPTDQQYGCEIVQMKKMGRCLKSVKLSEIKEAMKTIEQNDFYQSSLTRYSRILEEQSESPYNVGYWIDYTFKFGT